MVEGMTLLEDCLQEFQLPSSTKLNHESSQLNMLHLQHNHKPLRPRDKSSLKSYSVPLLGSVSARCLQFWTRMGQVPSMDNVVFSSKASGTREKMLCMLC